MSIHPYYKTEFDINPSYTFDNRRRELEERASLVLRKAEPSTTKKIEVLWERDWCCQIPAAFEDEIGCRWIRVPLSFAISPKEFPDDLQVSGADDPQLDGEEYYRRLDAWTNSLFPQHEPVHGEWDREHKEAFKAYIRFMEEPALAMKAFDYVLTHEIGHHFHDHQNPFTWFTNSAMVAVSLLVGVVVAQYSILLGVLTAPVLFGILFTSVWIYVHRLHEKQADEFAAQHIEGAEYLFEKMREAMQAIRAHSETSCIKKCLITSSGELLPQALTHGFTTTRLQIMREVVEKNSPAVLTSSAL